MTEKPPAATNFHVRADVRALHARWNHVPRQVGKYFFVKYWVIRFIDRVGENQTAHETTEDRMSFTDLDPARIYGILVGTEYQYYNPEVDWWESVVVDTPYVVCRPLKNPAPTPANLKVRRSFDEIHISWDKVAETHERRKFETYHLIRYEKNVATPVHVATKETEYRDKNVKGGKEYAYYVASHYSAEEGSEGVNFAMSAYTPPAIILFKDYKLVITVTHE